MRSFWDVDWSVVFVYGVLPPFVVVGALLLWKLARVAIAYQRRKSAHRMAARLLRVHRPSVDDRWGSRDWEWAYRKVGTPEALDMADTAIGLPKISLAAWSAVRAASIGQPAPPARRRNPPSTSVERGPWWHWGIVGVLFLAGGIQWIVDPPVSGPGYIVALVMLGIAATASQKARTQFRQRQVVVHDRGPEIEQIP